MTAPERPWSILPEGAQRQLLAGLPAAALRLAPDVLAGLAAVGLRRVGDLQHLPRAPLARRFGAAVGRRLDQAFGAEAEPVSPAPHEKPWVERIAFAEPVVRREDVAAALGHLLGGLCRRLERSRLGARRLEFRLQRADHRRLAIPLGTARPLRDPLWLARLFAERLEGIDLGPETGIEAASLHLLAADPLDALQPELAGGAADPAPALAALVERLESRLGEAAVASPRAVESHWPERAVREVSPLAPGLGGHWPFRLRPLRLRHRPLAVPPPGTAGEGPERLAPEWWRGTSETPRDYWRQEDERGLRRWLFRTEGGWYLHGLFA